MTFNPRDHRYLTMRDAANKLLLGAEVFACVQLVAGEAPVTVKVSTPLLVSKLINDPDANDVETLLYEDYDGDLWIDNNPKKNDMTSIENPPARVIYKAEYVSSITGKVWISSSHHDTRAEAERFAREAEKDFGVSRFNRIVKFTEEC